MSPEVLRPPEVLEPLEALGWDADWQRVFEALGAEGWQPGRVTGEHRSHMQVAVRGGEISAEVPGRLWNDASVRTDLPGVGDFVAVNPSDGDGPAIIEAVLPRRSAMIRQAAGERRPQLIAANVDIVMIMTALDGDFSAERIERYLALVRESGALPVIVINKSDIGEGRAAALAELEVIAAGVAVHVISAHRRSDVALLERHFEGGKTIALIGSSGVGKSTLTNQLLGREAQVTQTVSEHDNRGRHTTTHRELFLRPGGGAIMDTPGMGGLVLWDGEAESEPEPEEEFADIEALAAGCKFRNCGHVTEPNCAVRAAVESGEIDAGHLERYLAEQ